MAIEVKQLIIKSQLVNQHSESKPAEPATIDLERVRETLLAECREMISDSLEKQRDR